ncbi:ABC-type tungstate transport system permease protein [Desulfocucumis palustris]|uniref:ABC-type tungstate transport system permease protein n=1 Tax=Desulfocucumis palustris TaxID=1898651 RepID=A0A2L2XFN3_9FIRM|nr:ABC transporter permease [Desulfocucumis palustris]GBF35147.1 ABC-type tungstate transport system permease protein [Desulfocucumis palustris]
MELIWHGLLKALELLLHMDREVFGITFLTLKVSGLATLISVAIGVPLGVFLAIAVFPGRNVAVSLVNFGMGLPPVVVGLWVSIFLWRSGPLGFLNMMYTPAAIILAQAIIASPIVTGFTIAAIGQLNPKIRLQIMALGASRLQFLRLLLREARMGLLAAIIAGFGGVVSEVGASMMVGGNIYHYTRVLTTATVMEVSKGNFDLAIAISIILMLLAYVVTFSLTMLQQRGRNL